MRGARTREIENRELVGPSKAQFGPSVHLVEQKRRKKISFSSPLRNRKKLKERRKEGRECPTREDGERREEGCG